MRAFSIKAGTKVGMVAPGKEWFGDYWKEHYLQHDRIFFVEDIVIDPTGIGSRYACTPGCVTVGSNWAEAGYYGFKLDESYGSLKGYIVLVGASNVEVR